MQNTEQILIVGAGPVGLSLAIMLTMGGLKCRVIDKRLRQPDLLRAIAISKATENLFQEIRVFESIKASACFVESMILNHYSFQEKLVLDYSNTKLANPYFLHIYQPQIETILIERLEDLGVQVDRGFELVDLSDYHDGVDVVVSNSVASHRCNYKYVVGCDGASSTVRALAKIKTIEKLYNCSFVLADVLVSEHVSLKHVLWYIDEEGYLAIIPGTNNRVRIIYSSAQVQADEPSARLLESILKSRADVDLKIADIVWETKSIFRHQVAETGQKNRILLAGDSYHIFSPIGGVNMNFGLQDARLLSKILLSSLDQQNSHNNELFHYEELRRSEIEKAIKFTHTLSKLMTKPTKYKKIWNFSCQQLSRNINFKKELMGHLSGLAEQLY